jgi:uncharacterized protein (TIGR02147 family)
MTSYQQLLKDELVRRNSKNPRYSLRGFARDLGISQAFLSQILSRKRKLSDEKAILIADKLRLNATGRKLFVTLARLEQAQGVEVKKILNSQVERLQRKHPKFRILTEDVFKVVAEWYHFAIVELTQLRDFKEEPQWIARKLGIPVVLVKPAIEKLRNVGLITERHGRLQKSEIYDCQYPIGRDSTAPL